MRIVTQPEFGIGTINIGWLFIAIGLAGILSMIIGAILLELWEADISVACEPETNEEVCESIF